MQTSESQNFVLATGRHWRQFAARLYRHRGRFFRQCSEAKKLRWRLDQDRGWL